MNRREAIQTTVSLTASAVFPLSLLGSDEGYTPPKDHVGCVKVGANNQADYEEFRFAKQDVMIVRVPYGDDIQMVAESIKWGMKDNPNIFVVHKSVEIQVKTMQKPKKFPGRLVVVSDATPGDVPPDDSSYDPKTDSFFV